MSRLHSLQGLHRPHWPRRLRCVHPDERGLGTLLFAVGLLPFMLLFGALVVHVGSELALRRDLQGVADAAALAGVQDAVTSQSTAIAEAESNAAKNINNLTSTTVETGTDGVYQYLTVTVVKPNESLFGGYLALSPATISATAVARILIPAQPTDPPEISLFK